MKDFIANRRWSEDLAKDINPGGSWDTDHPAKGYVYAEKLYIEKVQASWPKPARDRGDWCLTIGDAQYITHDLPLLEHKLYKFAVAEGFVSKPAVTGVMNRRKSSVSKPK